MLLILQAVLAKIEMSIIKPRCACTVAKKILYFAALALSALRRLRVQSGLLDGIFLEALLLVVCTKGPIYKKGVDTSLHPSTSWG